MADTAGNLKDWSTTASSNFPADATTIGAGLADNLQEIQKVVRQDLASKGADIASATTTDLGAVPGLMHDITGTTAITGFGTVSAGIWKILKFEGVLTLTHHATSLILLSGFSRTTKVGDVGIYFSEGSGNWRELSYTSVNSGGVRPGAVMDHAGSTAPEGWLECDGSAVSRTTYAALFTAIGEVWGAGDTSTTFNLPDFRSKARIGKGTGTVTESITNAAITTGTDTIAVTSNSSKWITGMQVTWTVSGTPPTTSPANLLDNADTVFVIRTGATSIKFATTLANAQAGTAIDITAAGSGTFTLTHTYTARALGEYGGEEAHAMSSTELLAHTHPVNGASSAANGVDVNIPGSGGGSSGSTGGNAAMNIMQPFGVVMTIIKI